MPWRAAGDRGGWVFVAPTSADLVSVAWSVAQLLEVSGSAVAPKAHAWLTMVPVAEADTVPVMVTVTVAPAATVPMVQVTAWVVRVQPSWVLVAPVAVTSAGNASVTTTPSDDEGPVLVTVTV